VFLNKKHSFELTSEQVSAIHDVGVSSVDVSFTTSGMVNATVFEDSGIICYTFRKDGGIVKEVRNFFDDGWVTTCRDLYGRWIDEEGQEVE